MLMNCRDRSDGILNSAPFMLTNTVSGEQELVLCQRTDTVPPGHTFEELDYWQDEHPDFPREDWRYLVDNGDTLLGYWEWCIGKERSRDSESDDEEEC